MRVTSAQRLARFLAAAGIEPSVVGDGQVPVGPDVVIDNRAATAGSLFIGLPGERVDGADFAAAAAERGAPAAVGRSGAHTSELQSPTCSEDCGLGV